MRERRQRRTQIVLTHIFAVPLEFLILNRAMSFRIDESLFNEIESRLKHNFQRRSPHKSVHIKEFLPPSIATAQQPRRHHPSIHPSLQPSYAFPEYHHGTVLYSTVPYYRPIYRHHGLTGTNGRKRSAHSFIVHINIAFFGRHTIY